MTSNMVFSHFCDFYRFVYNKVDFPFFCKLIEKSETDAYAVAKFESLKRDFGGFLCNSPDYAERLYLGFLTDKHDIISFARYQKQVLDFHQESEQWGGFDRRNFYTTGSFKYQETCDNAHGGLDVLWAFHQNIEDVEISMFENYKKLVYEYLDTIDK